MSRNASWSFLKARAAWLLSGLLSRFVLVPFFSVFFVLAVSENRWEFLKVYLFCVGCSAGVPAVYIGYNVYSGKITDMHVKLLNQRRGPFRAGMFGLACQAIGLWGIGAPRVLVVYAVSIFISSLLFATISERWKISVHTGVLGTLLAGALVILHWSPWWLLLQGPLIWARAHRKRHHARQGLGGALLGFLPSWLGLTYFA